MLVQSVCSSPSIDDWVSVAKSSPRCLCRIGIRSSSLFSLELFFSGLLDGSFLFASQGGGSIDFCLLLLHGHFPISCSLGVGGVLFFL